MKIAYIFLNGELLGDEEFYKNYISKNKGDIYSADGGANLLKKLEILPLEIWGDFDSVDLDILNEYKKNNVIIKNFPKDKDYTDGELIIQYVSSKGYDEIVIIGGLGGRKDHELSNINLLFLYKNIIFLTQNEKLFRVENKEILREIKGKTISFVPFSDRVEKLSLKGFKYPLKDYNLSRGESICMSNIAISDICEIEFLSGKLIGIIIN